MPNTVNEAQLVRTNVAHVASENEEFKITPLDRAQLQTTRFCHLVIAMETTTKQLTLQPLRCCQFGMRTHVIWYIDTVLRNVLRTYSGWKILYKIKTVRCPRKLVGPMYVSNTSVTSRKPIHCHSVINIKSTQHYFVRRNIDIRAQLHLKNCEIVI